MKIESLNHILRVCMRVLLVEDDDVLGDALNQSLINAGYAVDWAKDGRYADHALHDQVYDAVVLDLGLPIMDGLTVLQRLRQRKIEIPVLILSARDGLDDRIKALDLGADDYLTKPFKLKELEARLRALIRRANSNSSNLINVGTLTLNTSERIISAHGKMIVLSKREFGVLELLMLRNGRAVSKEALIENLYNWSEEVSTNAIEVYIFRVRKKLEPYSIRINNISGLGYMLENPPLETAKNE